MSATTGIAPAQELVDAFASAGESTRFIKVSIVNETLVHDASIKSAGSFLEDLGTLQTVLQDSVPSYVLARLDAPATGWLAISYVPDSAKVRDKMVYAATRASLTKSLGGAHFTDSLFATSKADLTPDAYQAHRRHADAPKPLSTREKEMAEIKAAERENGGTAYDGSRTRQNHIGGAGVGINWSAEVEHAVLNLVAEGDAGRLVVITIEPSSETLVLDSNGEASPADIGSKLPGDPCYALYSWVYSGERRVVFIYACPSTSSIKYRMVYSSGVGGVFLSAKTLLATVNTTLPRKIETSDPKDIDETWLVSEIGLSASGGDTPSGTPTPVEDKKAFAKPRGPGRKR